MKKILKKATCGILALTAAVTSVGMFTACETSYPEVEMKIEFNDETYVLNYKLYRKVAPATVNHFITLAKNGYYDGMCVHNFEEGSAMYTGGYTYQKGADNGGLVYKEYYDIVSQYKDFPHTVWTDTDKATATYTLAGEFSENSFVVENGALAKSFGALTMYYTEKNTDERVAVKRQSESKSGKDVSYKEYKYNSATSQFSICLSEESSTDNFYCTFAKLTKDGEDELEDLLEDIAELYETDFVEEHSVKIDEDDIFVADYGVSADYLVPLSPIVIKSVKVTKY